MFSNEFESFARKYSEKSQKSVLKVFFGLIFTACTFGLYRLIEEVLAVGFTANNIRLLFVIVMGFFVAVIVPRLSHKNQKTRHTPPTESKPHDVAAFYWAFQIFFWALQIFFLLDFLFQFDLAVSESAIVILGGFSFIIYLIIMFFVLRFFFKKSFEKRFPDEYVKKFG